VKHGRRTLIIVVSLLALSAAVAAVVLGARSGDVTALGPSAGDGGEVGMVAQTPSPAPTSGVESGALDPAKQEPILDLFTAKDPFAPLGGFQPEPTPQPTPQPTTSPTEFPESADITVEDINYTVTVGDEVPPDDPIFYIVDITSYGVTFEFLDGQAFEDGSTSVEVAEGQEIIVTAAETGESYRLAVLTLNYTGGGTNGDDTNGGTNGGGSAQGHTIEALSINTQGGVDTATLKVDGTTYADKAVGDKFTTDYGEIKIIAIDAGAQTVTILHGDDTIVLRVGQKVDK